MAWLKRLEIPLDRDVVLLAVADEEVGNTGAAQLAEPERWKSIGCSHLMNEGGLGIRDALFDGQAVHAISVAEKGTLWVNLVAEGRAGHGSVPRPDEEAPERLRSAMEAMARYKPVYKVDDSLYTLLANIGDHKGGVTGAVLAEPVPGADVRLGKAGRTRRRTPRCRTPSTSPGCAGPSSRTSSRAGRGPVRLPAARRGRSPRATSSG